VSKTARPASTPEEVTLVVTRLEIRGEWHLPESFGSVTGDIEAPEGFVDQPEEMLFVTWSKGERATAARWPIGQQSRVRWVPTQFFPSVTGNSEVILRQVNRFAIAEVPGWFVPALSPSECAQDGRR
jgi:hypothetical protein